MKDWLTTVLQIARNCKDSDNLEDVATAFVPLLRALSFSSGESPAKLVCKALSDYCLSNAAKAKDAANEMYERMPTVEPMAKQKSGTLDKLNDDCLRVAFSFLGFEDRCNAVERSCQRLCRLSRTAAIHCKQMDDVFTFERTHEMTPSRVHSVVRRFVFDSFLANGLHYGDHCVVVSTALSVSHRHLTSFTGRTFIRFANLEFPKLSTFCIDCTGDNDHDDDANDPMPQSTWLDFIAKRPQIENVRIVNAELNVEMISRLSEMKHIRVLRFLATPPMASALPQKTCDFSHLTSFDFESQLLTGDTPFSCIAPFVTENLRSLRLLGFGDFPRLTLPKLKSQCVWDHASEFLEKVHTPALTKCETDMSSLEDVCSMLKMAHVREFEFQSMSLALAFFQEREHLAEWSQKLQTICCESQFDGVKISLASFVHKVDGSEAIPPSSPNVQAMYAHWLPVGRDLLQNACVGCDVILRENVRLSLL